MILRDMTSVYTIGSGFCAIMSQNSKSFGRSPRHAEPGLTDTRFYYYYGLIILPNQEERYIVLVYRIF
jgi:hypothetical protein